MKFNTVFTASLLAILVDRIIQWIAKVAYVYILTP